MKNPWIVLAMGVGLAAGACAPEMGAEVEDVDSTSIEIAVVPVGVKCIWLSATSGSKTIQKGFTLAAGDPSASLVLGSLPAGAATMTGKAYETACPNGGGAPSGIARWLAPSTAFQIVAGLPSHVALTFRLADGPVDGTADFEQAAIMVSPGNYAAIALVGDGTLRTWGASIYGELGDGSTGFHRWLPGAVTDPGFTNLIGVSGGNNRTCAYNPDHMWCWGRGPLGVGAAETNSTTPVAVPRPWPGGTMAAMQQGENNTCFTDTFGFAWCWGSNAAGQLNAPASTIPVATPARVGSSSWRSFAIGADFSCGVLGEGRPICFGANTYGQLGNSQPGGHTEHYVNLLAIDGITAGQSHACGRRGDSTVWCWGRNQYGQLGDGTTADRNTPVQVVGLTDAVQVSAGIDFTCALRAGGTVACWGNNQAGQLGTGNGASTTAPAQAMGLTDIVSVNAIPSSNTVCATRKDGAAFCWGYGGLGQVGDGKGVTQFVPQRVDL